MPTFADRLKAMEADPQFKALSPQAKQAERLALQRKVEGEAQQRTTASMQAERKNIPGAGIAQSVGAFVSGAADTATAGYAGPIGAQFSGMLPPMAGGGRSEADFAGEQAAIAQQNPGAFRAGQFAGGFVGPISKGIGALSKGVGSAAKAMIPQSLESNFAKRALVNLVGNVTGATAAVGAYEAGKHQTDPDMPNRLAAAAYGIRDAATNPLMMGLVGAGSLAQTKLIRPRAAENASMIDRFERVTGKKVPIEVLTDSADQRATYDALARAPGMADRVAKQKADAITGLSSMLEEFRAGAGARGGGIEGTRAAAASAVRRLVGDETPSPVTASRKASTKAGIAANAEPQLAATQMLASAVEQIESSRSKLAMSQMGPVFDKIRELAKDNRGLNAQDLEELRQQVAGLAKFAKSPVSETGARAGTRTDYEAGQLYEAITYAARATAPEYSNALGVAKSLHRMEEALGEVPIARIDDKQAADFFKAGDVPARWQALQKNSTPEDVAALRGWYWYRLLRQVSNPSTNAIDPNRLQRVTSDTGPFNSQVVEMVLPGVLPELRDYAKFTKSLFGKGRFGAEGSQTAGRAAQYAGQLASGTAVGTAMHMLSGLTNPFGAVAVILGPVGARSALRSALGGVIEEQSQRATRQGPTPMGRSAVGLNQATRGLLTTLPGMGGPTQ